MIFIDDDDDDDDDSYLPHGITRCYPAGHPTQMNAPGQP